MIERLFLSVNAGTCKWPGIEKFRLIGVQLKYFGRRQFWDKLNWKDEQVTMWPVTTPEGQIHMAVKAGSTAVHENPTPCTKHCVIPPSSCIKLLYLLIEK